MLTFIPFFRLCFEPFSSVIATNEKINTHSLILDAISFRRYFILRRYFIKTLFRSDLLHLPTELPEEDNGQLDTNVAQEIPVSFRFFLMFFVSIFSFSLLFLFLFTSSSRRFARFFIFYGTYRITIHIQSIVHCKNTFLHQKICFFFLSFNLMFHYFVVNHKWARAGQCTRQSVNCCLTEAMWLTITRTRQSSASGYSSITSQ